MSRDYKHSQERPKNTKKGNPFFTGLLVGFLLGVGTSLAVVVYIKGGESPFANSAETSKPKDTAKIDAKETTSDSDATPAAAPADKKENSRFDFYTILPGGDNKVLDDGKKTKNESQQVILQNTYYLQTGAFQTAEEADNMKAKLALQGFEALVQTATLPDKGVWHRVRIGPFKDLDKINKTKTDLINNGFKADLVQDK